MRTEKEMLDLILGFAQKDPRVCAAYMNGSRANPAAPKDVYQDYDIVYVVRNFSEFVANQCWIDIFGERLMLQMPEAMREPCGAGHFNWMMLFADGNRLDLTLVPIEKPELIMRDSQTIVLLDKEGILPNFPKPCDCDYHVCAPSELFFSSCCNNFWWCMQNVAKGIARRELPYAMLMYHTIVRQDLHDMVSWYIGVHHDFRVSTGKMGKYFEKYLPHELYAQYMKTYSDSNFGNMWQAISEACDLFRALATDVGQHINYAYNLQDDSNMCAYISRVKAGFYE